MSTTVNNLIGPLQDACTTVNGDCKQHGDFTSPALWIGGTLVNATPECPQCSELCRSVETLNAEREVKEKREAILRTRITESGIPLRIRNAGRFEPTTDRSKVNLDIFKRYFAEFPEKRKQGSNLILTGNPGTGKTHLVGRLGISLLEAYSGLSIVYTTAADMLRYVRGAYARDAAYSETQAIKKFTDCDLLIIDEVGVKLASDHDKAILFEVIDQRYQDVSPSIVISNLRAVELEQATDERMIDRLKHNGELLLFDWESYRGGEV